MRSGLPRRPGGDPWPPAGVAPVVPAAPAASAPGEAIPDAAETTPAGAVGAGSVASAPPVPTRSGSPLRRGLPRTPGGEPWPSAGAAAPPAATVAPASASPADGAISASRPQEGAAPSPDSGALAATRAETTEPPAASPVADAGAEARRGLPRVVGGEPWPPAGTRAAIRPEPADGATSASGHRESPAPSPETAAIAPAAPETEPDTAAGTATAPERPVAPAVVPLSERMPLTVPRTVWPGRAAYHRPPARPEPVRIGPFTRGQWIGAVLVGGAGLLVAAGLAVAFVRVVLSLPAMQDFLVAYPGEYHLPETAPVGIPAWIGWQHFFNAFFMLLIIRTGLQIRTEKRPAVFWTPRGNKKGKTSLTIWFHQSLDLLWLVNGAVFVVLLFVTGQWMRIIPTSWEVFPNALSAALQYVSLDWPTENGWVNYNALQQLAYFSTVFLAAPLAVISGYRMSALWPKGNARLSAAYPIEWARKVHFPVMLYFVAFIIVHVALVFATGALRNLNHMYAAQGSVDGVAYADNWTGFWIFVASVAVMAGGWIAARPLVLAPIAKLFGTVSGR